MKPALIAALVAVFSGAFVCIFAAINAANVKKKGEG